MVGSLLLGEKSITKQLNQPMNLMYTMANSSRNKICHWQKMHTHYVMMEVCYTLLVGVMERNKHQYALSIEYNTISGEIFHLLTKRGRPPQHLYLIANGCIL